MSREVDSTNIQIFKCPISKNQLEFRYVNDSVHCEYSLIDENLFKSYFVLLRNAIDVAIEKGCKTFVQMVYRTEYKEYLEDDERWEIVNSTVETVVIKCDINDAISCIARGFGIKC